MKPVDVAVDDDTLYLLDLLHSRVQLFDKTTGDVKNSIGQGNEGIQNLALPTNMTVDNKAFVYVSNMGSGRLIKLDRDGHYITGVGKLGSGLSQFGRPKGIAVDQDGLIYTVDAAAQLVQVFDDQMRLLMFFGNPGSPGGVLNVPASIAISTDNLPYYQQFAAPDFQIEKVIFVTSQFGANKINIYGLGKKKGLDYEADYRKGLDERKKLEEKYKAETEKRRREAEEKKFGEKASKPADLMTAEDVEIEKAREK
jgi:hypothetical protein